MQAPATYTFNSNLVDADIQNQDASEVNSFENASSNHLPFEENREKYYNAQKIRNGEVLFNIQTPPSDQVTKDSAQMQITEEMEGRVSQFSQGHQVQMFKHEGGKAATAQASRRKNKKGDRSASLLAKQTSVTTPYADPTPSNKWKHSVPSMFEVQSSMTFNTLKGRIQFHVGANDYFSPSNKEQSTSVNKKKQKANVLKSMQTAMYQKRFDALSHAKQGVASHISKPSRDQHRRMLSLTYDGKPMRIQSARTNGRKSAQQVAAGIRSQAAFSPEGRSPFIEIPTVGSPLNIENSNRTGTQKSFNIRKQSKHIRWYSQAQKHKETYSSRKRATSSCSQRNTLNSKRGPASISQERSTSVGPSKNTETAVRIYQQTQKLKAERRGNESARSLRTSSSTSTLQSATKSNKKRKIVQKLRSKQLLDTKAAQITRDEDDSPGLKRKTTTLASEKGSCEIKHPVKPSGNVYRRKTIVANAYMSNLKPYEKQGMAPGQAIEALKRDIQKKQKENSELVEKVKSFNEKITTLNKKRAEFQEKTDQANQDKKELMRDLATYEANFAQQPVVNNEPLHEKLVGISDTINDTLGKIRDLTNLRQTSGWISEGQKDTLIGMLGKLDQLKRLKKPANHSFLQNQGVKNIMSALKHSLTAKLSQNSSIKNDDTGLNFLYKESHIGLISVSGQQCMVQAEYVSGSVQGSLSSKRSNKNLRFDFKPISGRRGRNIKAELNRLYFDQRRDKQGRLNVVLLVKKEEEIVSEDPELELYYLAKLKGIEQGYKNLILQMSKDRQFITATVVIKDQRLSYKMVCETTNTVSFDANDSSIEGNQPVKSLLTWAKELEEKLVVYQRENGNYDLRMFKDALDDVWEKKPSKVHLNAKNSSYDLGNDDVNTPKSRQHKIKLDPEEQDRLDKQRAEMAWEAKQSRDDSSRRSMFRQMTSRSIVPSNQTSEKVSGSDKIKKPTNKSPSGIMSQFKPSSFRKLAQPLLKKSSSAVALPSASRGEDAENDPERDLHAIEQEDRLSACKIEVKALDPLQAYNALKETPGLVIPDVNRKESSGNKLDQLKTLDQTEIDLNFFELLYKKRLAQSFKRFYNLILRRDRDKKEQEERAKEADQCIDTFLNLFKQEIKMREVVDGSSKIQQKYFKSNKPISKHQLNRIFQKNQVVAEEVVTSLSERIVGEGNLVKLLFYKDHEEMLHMMIGIDKKLDSDAESSSTLMSSSDSEDSKNPKRQKDSIYFMTIRIETKFFTYLDDPNLTNEADFLDNLGSLITNDTFIECLKKEIKFKRKRNKTKVKQSSESVVKSVTKSSGKRMHDLTEYRRKTTDDSLSQGKVEPARKTTKEMVMNLKAAIPLEVVEETSNLNTPGTLTPNNFRSVTNSENESVMRETGQLPYQQHLNSDKNQFFQTYSQILNCI